MTYSIRFIIFVITLLILSSLGLSPCADAERERIALVIGNAAYPEYPLTNPVNDAKDMARLLETFGFTVSLHTDINYRTMLKAIQQFGRQISDGDVTLFYFSGHGLQSENINYLLPLHANIKSEADIRFESVNANRVLAHLEQANQRGVNLIILDACRYNPFKGFLKSSKSGLAEMSSPTGSFLAYATAPGSVAYDNGNQSNSTYTRHLLNVLREMPNDSVSDVFTIIRQRVLKETDWKQVPWEATSLTQRFCFGGCASSIPGGIVQPTSLPVVSPPHHLRSTPQTVSKENARRVFGLTTRQMAWGETDWAPASYIDNQYEDRGSTVYDAAIGLTWQKNGSSKYMTYEDAREYVKKLNRERFAGFADWRLPTIPELMSLLEPKKSSNGLYIDSIFDKTQRWVWSVDKRQVKGESGSSSVAWLVDFYYGDVGWNYLLSEDYVRCVRS